MQITRNRIFWLLFIVPATVFAQTNCEEGAGPLNHAKPAGITPAEIIQKFAAQESYFNQEFMHYSYSRDIKVETLDGDTVTGEFRQVSNIHWDNGKMKEYVTFAPQSSLRGVSMSKEDFDDINHSPFILTAEDLHQYDLLYDGQQKVDELQTYVFDVAPKKIEPGMRYFQGRVWVEKTELQEVKSCGKMVPDTIAQPLRRKKKKKQQVEENVSPTAVTYREQIDGKYWFPTYVRSDSVIHFAFNDARIREIIKYTNYKLKESVTPGVLSAGPQK